jgi:hypothetical protein
MERSSMIQIVKAREAIRRANAIHPFYQAEYFRELNEFYEPVLIEVYNRATHQCFDASEWQCFDSFASFKLNRAHRPPTTFAKSHVVFPFDKLHIGAQCSALTCMVAAFIYGALLAISSSLH